MSKTGGKAEKFDPNGAADGNSGIFGLPHTEAEAALVLLPVPWEATTSYGGGTSDGPAAILAASRQVDLFDLDVRKPYESGIFMRDEDPEIRRWNAEGKTEAARIIAVGGRLEGDVSLVKSLARVNELSALVNEAVLRESRQVLAAGKILGVVGGDHSVPLGALRAIAEKHGEFGILHFDAHSDTRDAYEGFTYSHASIMRNVLDAIPQVTQLVQVGIRDFCEEEVLYCRAKGNRVKVFYDGFLQFKKFDGQSFSAITQEILKSLPEKVWVSFDIDGLDPRFCPHTGTPVPGGLDFNEANYILAQLVRGGRTLLGFDLNEVAPAPDGKDEWDANVGARLLYKLCAWTLASQGKNEVQ